MSAASPRTGAALALAALALASGCSKETLPLPPETGPPVRIAFVSNRPPASRFDGDIYFYDAARGGAPWLPPNLNTISTEGALALSADGSTLAMWSDRLPTGSLASLFLYDVAAARWSIPGAINTLPGPNNPALSADGSRLAVQYQVGGPFELFVGMMDVPADTLVPLPSINAPFFATIDPHLNDDASLMVVASNGPRSMGAFDILLYSVPGDSFLALPGLNTVNQELSPSISGDGRYVAFQSGDPRGVGLVDVYVYDRTTATFLALPGANTTLSEYQPTISADGRWMVYTTDAEGGTDVVLYDLVRRERVPLPGLNHPLFEDALPVVVTGTGTSARAPRTIAAR